jgi:hypothetical protein
MRTLADLIVAENFDDFKTLIAEAREKTGEPWVEIEADFGGDTDWIASVLTNDGELVFVTAGFPKTLLMEWSRTLQVQFEVTE